jgi:hypothetical protein
MIFATRVSQIGAMQVANIALLKDFSSPLIDRAKSVFRTFDEAYLKVKSDKDSTKLYHEQDASDQRLMELNTATHSTLRSIHRTTKLFGELYTIGMDRNLGSTTHEPAEDKSIWSNLPPWTRCFVETGEGELSEITCEPNFSKASDLTWKKWQVSSSDIFLHVTFFNRLPDLSFHSIDRDDHPLLVARLSSLVVSGLPIPSVRLRLKTEEW